MWKNTMYMFLPEQQVRDATCLEYPEFPDGESTIAQGEVLLAQQGSNPLF